MALNYPKQGEGYVSAYQISATPYVTSSTVALGAVREIVFPQVTKFITLKNMSTSTNTIAVSFTRAGLTQANSNYFILSGSESFSGELRTDRIFISGSGGSTNNFTLLAGLTFIPSTMLTTITGSNGFQGVG